MCGFDPRLAHQVPDDDISLVVRAAQCAGRAENPAVAELASTGPVPVWNRLDSLESRGLQGRHGAKLGCAGPPVYLLADNVRSTSLKWRLSPYRLIAACISLGRPA